MKGNTPGPGAYGCGVCINPVGNYSLSTHPNSGAQNWSPSKKRFADPAYQNRLNPGPGNYN